MAGSEMSLGEWIDKCAKRGPLYDGHRAVCEFRALESQNRELKSFVRTVSLMTPAFGDRLDFCGAIELAGKILKERE